MMCPTRAKDIEGNDVGGQLQPFDHHHDLAMQAEKCQHTEPRHVPMPVADHLCSTVPLTTRRRITGKRKPSEAPTGSRLEPSALRPSRGANGWDAGPANSLPKGDGMHSVDADAVCGTSLGPEGARLRVGTGVTGAKRTRPADECDGTRLIGSEDRPLAHARGEMNTEKSTFDLHAELGAVGPAADGASAAAAASHSPSRTRSDA